MKILRLLTITALLSRDLLCAEAQSSIAPRPTAPEARADRLMNQANDLIDGGQIKEGLAKFKEAYATLPRSMFLAAIGSAYYDAGDAQAAANWYQRYLESGDRTHAADVGAMLQYLDEQLARLSVTVIGPPGATVELRVGDDAWMPAASWVWLRPGPFVVAARVLGDERIQLHTGKIESDQVEGIVLDLREYQALLADGATLRSYAAGRREQRLPVIAHPRPKDEADLRDPTLEVFGSIGVTAAASLLWYLGRDEVELSLPMGLLTIAAPALGHLRAGDPWTSGFTMRCASAIPLLVGSGLISQGDDDHFGWAFVSIGLTGIIGGAVWDFAALPAAIRRHDSRGLSIRPSIVPVSGGASAAIVAGGSW